MGPPRRRAGDPRRVGADLRRHGERHLPRAPLSAARGFAALAAPLCLTLAVACTAGEQRAADTSVARAATNTVAPATATAERVPVLAVQLGAFSDSANASRMRDSLARAGWAAYVEGSAPGSAPAFHVRVAASRDSTLPRLIVAALALEHRTAVVVKDEARTDSLSAASVLAVNGGAHGMTANVRWAVAGDRRAILVVEDPVGAEADPVPDAFVYADEATGLVLQRDSVWDAEPSPDWRRLAVGIAFVIRGGGRPEIPATEWSALARRSGLALDSVKKSTFPGSGMSAARGLAQPGTYDLTVAPASAKAVPVVLPMAGGWRVGWSANGEALLVGTNPARAGDDESSPRFLAVDLRGRALAGAADSPAPVAWTDGPTLDLGVPVDFTSRHTIAAGARSIDSENGWITAESHGRRSLVGPGSALVATASGRFVVAVVAAPRTNDREQPARLVVYDLGA